MRTKLQTQVPRTAAFMLPVLLAFFAVSFGDARAQNVNAPDPEAEGAAAAAARVPRGAGGGANALELLRVLNLSPEQREQINAIRRETAPQARLLGARLRQARRALDEVIYLNNADETLVEERSREFASAQAAVARLRSLSELKIRRVLTPAQLDAFRDLQQQTRTRQRANRRAAAQSDFNGDDVQRRANRIERRLERQQQQQRQQRQQKAQPPSNNPAAAPSSNTQSSPNTTPSPTPRAPRRNPLRRARRLRP